MREVAITTLDNPYDPFNEFDKWFMWDINHGYYTASYLDHVARNSDEFGEELQARILESAIDEIIEIHGGGIYRKLVRNDHSDDPSYQEAE